MNMTAETIEEKIFEKEYVLKAIDRCDSCGAQAYVMVKGVTGELLFCSHHYNKNKKRIECIAHLVHRLARKHLMRASPSEEVKK